MNKATGKSGRMTFSTIAMNDTTVGGEITAAATKHRDPKTLMGYVAAKPGVLMAAAIEIGKAVKNSNNPNRLAGVELSPVVENDSEVIVKRPRSSVEVSTNNENFNPNSSS